MLSGVDAGPRWVRLWFRGAALYGAVALAGALLLPPPVTARLDHYAFILTALAFQLVFWIVGGDPVRHRAAMLAGVLEKLAFGVPALILVARGDVPGSTAVFGAIDLVLGAGFLAAWRTTPSR